MPNDNNLKIGLLLKILKQFDGNRDKLHEFIENADTAMRLASEDDSPTVFEFIKCNITGKARSQIRNREFDDWPALREYLKINYSDKRSHSHYQVELGQCKQGANEAVMIYANRIETLLLKLCNSLEEGLGDAEKKANIKLLQTQALNVFLNGLNDSLTVLVKSQKPPSLEEAVSLAAAEEMMLRDRSSKSQQSPSSFCNYCKKHGHLITECRKKAHREAQKGKTDFKTNTNVSTVNSDKVCNYCKKVGHLIGECRKREYNNRKRAQVNCTDAQAGNEPNRFLSAEARSHVVMADLLQ